MNQATLKCLVGGLEVTPDNVVLMIGDFFDPSQPQYARLIDEIMHAVDDVTSVKRLRRN